MIASEDRYAVKQYFEFFHSTRIQFRVLETEHGESAPQHVIDRLSEYIDEYEIGDGDQLWLVCDTDHWIEPGHIKNLVEVVRLCRQKGIGAALSNPCFDLWVLLHFADFPSETSLTCTEVGEQIRAAAGQYNKTKVYNLPIDDERVRSAISRAKGHYDSSIEIPTVPQTSIFLILEDLVQRGLVSIPAN